MPQDTFKRDWIFGYLHETIEFGETPTDALKRELKEEANLNIENCILAGTETMILEGTHWLGLYYRAYCKTSDINNLEPDKHAKIEWRTMEFAKANLTPEASGFLDVCNNFYNSASCIKVSSK
jgi:ADP-ribose pyrophosphatase YjhB (NUDIX family)